MRQLLKDVIYINVAREVSQLATCPRASVGAVVLDAAGVVRATGYNGAPHGMKHCGDDCAHEGHCARSIHAEENAITHASPSSLRGGTIYCTHSPCPRCQLKIIQAGIARVVYSVAYRNDGPDLLAEAGVKVEAV